MKLSQYLTEAVDEIRALIVLKKLHLVELEHSTEWKTSVTLKDSVISVLMPETILVYGGKYRHNLKNYYAITPGGTLYKDQPAFDDRELKSLIDAKSLKVIVK